MKANKIEGLVVCILDYVDTLLRPIAESEETIVNLQKLREEAKKVCCRSKSNDVWPVLFDGEMLSRQDIQEVIVNLDQRISSLKQVVRLPPAGRESLMLHLSGYVPEKISMHQEIIGRYRMWHKEMLVRTESEKKTNNYAETKEALQRLMMWIDRMERNQKRLASAWLLCEKSYGSLSVPKKRENHTLNDFDPSLSTNENANVELK